MIEILRAVLGLSAAYAQDSGDSEDSEDSEDSGDTSDASDSSDISAPSTTGFETNASADPSSATDVSSATSSAQSDVESSFEHPLGDYASALMDFSQDLTRDLAQSNPDAEAILDMLSDMQRAQEIWASLSPSAAGNSTTQGSLMGDTQYASYLMADYQKIELLGMYFGFNPTYDTGGKHNGGSVHPAGKAVDFSVRGMSQAEIENFIRVMQYAGAYPHDERGHPLNASGKAQGIWDAPHVHVQSTPPAGNADYFAHPNFVPGTFMHYPK